MWAARKYQAVLRFLSLLRAALAGFACSARWQDRHVGQNTLWHMPQVSAWDSQIAIPQSQQCPVAARVQGTRAPKASSARLRTPTIPQRFIGCSQLDVILITVKGDSRPRPQVRIRDNLTPITALPATRFRRVRRLGMACLSCSSENQGSYEAEINIHFPGRENLDKANRLGVSEDSGLLGLWLLRTSN